MIYKITITLICENASSGMEQFVEVKNAAAAIDEAFIFASQIDYSQHTGGFGLTVTPVREDVATKTGHNSQASLDK